MDSIKELSNTIEYIENQQIPSTVKLVSGRQIIAGAFYHKYANKDWTYANGFNCKKKIGKGVKSYWE